MMHCRSLRAVVQAAAFFHSQSTKIMYSKKFIPDYYLQVYELAKAGESIETLSKRLSPPVKPVRFQKWYDSDDALKGAYNKGQSEFDPMSEASRLIDHPGQMAFLVAYAHCGTITHAMKNAGISRINYHDWSKDEKFMQAVGIAKQAFADRLVAAAVQRAVDGHRRYKFYKGQPLWRACDASHPEAQPYVNEWGQTAYRYHYYEVEYSDRMLELLLNVKVEEFRQVKLAASQANVNIKNDSNVQVNMGDLLNRLESARGRIIDADSVRVLAKQHIALIAAQQEEKDNEPI